MSLRGSNQGACLQATSPTNEELLERYRHADFDAFNVFYKRHQRLIFNFLLARLGHRADAEEAFQETFVRLHRSILSYDSAQNALGWTFAIARNISVDLIRQKSRRGPTMAGEDIAIGDRNESTLAARQELERLLAVLSFEERTLLVSRFFQEESFAEIADRQGVTEVSARQKVSRLLKKLKSGKS